MNYRRGLVVRKRDQRPTNERSTGDALQSRNSSRRIRRRCKKRTGCDATLVEIVHVPGATSAPRASLLRHERRAPLPEPGAHGFGRQLVAQVVPLAAGGGERGLLRAAEVRQQV